MSNDQKKRIYNIFFIPCLDFKETLSRVECKIKGPIKNYIHIFSRFSNTPTTLYSLLYHNTQSSCCQRHPAPLSCIYRFWMAPKWNWPLFNEIYIMSKSYANNLMVSLLVWNSNCQMKAKCTKHNNHYGMTAFNLHPHTAELFFYPHFKW